MITVNISGFEEIRNKIASIDMDRLCYKIASDLKGEIKHRVHEEGLASDGSKIGTYSKGYIKVRTGNYSDAARYKRGTNKGKFKEKKEKKGEAGVFTKGPRKGQPRPRYNRKETDIVLSLTRQMEMDMKATDPIPVQNGFGVGYSNDFNYDKAIWNEKRYGKPIWSLSKEENQLAQDIVKKYVDETNN